MIGAQIPIPVKPGVLIRNDIGGSDHDDNQPMVEIRQALAEGITNTVT